MRGNRTAAVGKDISAHRRILMMKCIHTRHCRLLERPFRHSRPNCLTAGKSLQKSNLISNGRLLRYMQVGPAMPQSDEVRHMLTEYFYCSFVPFISIGGADTVRLSHLAPRVYDH